MFITDNKCFITDNKIFVTDNKNAKNILNKKY